MKCRVSSAVVWKSSTGAFDLILCPSQRAAREELRRIADELGLDVDALDAVLVHPFDMFDCEKLLCALNRLPRHAPIARIEDVLASAKVAEGAAAINA
jgi:hypothetical protein